MIDPQRKNRGIFCRSNAWAGSTQGDGCPWKHAVYRLDRLNHTAEDDLRVMLHVQEVR